MSRIRSHVSYANVMATVAIFVALGGTSYAVTQLPRNSVGTNQIRTGAVGQSEIRKSAVRSKQVKDRAIGLQDVSLAARSSLRGQPGPTGPTGPTGPAGPPTATYGVVAESDGDYVRSRATSNTGAGHTTNTGLYTIGFNLDVSNCLVAATVAGVDTQPTNGEIVATVDGSRVFVRTANSAGAATDLPFHLIVSC